MSDNDPKESTVLSVADGTLRTVGVIKLWWNVIRNSFSVLVAVLLIVGLVNHHARWKSELANVESIRCKTPPLSQSDCEKGDTKGKLCSASKTQSCNMHVTGFKRQFRSNYLIGKSPMKGDAVKVYYDPLDKSTAQLATSDILDEHKTLIIAILIGLCVLGCISILFLVMVRKNRNAQRIFGGIAALQTLQTL